MVLLAGQRGEVRGVTVVRSVLLLVRFTRRMACNETPCGWEVVLQDLISRVVACM
jgi:hypothetical protein